MSQTKSFLMLAGAALSLGGVNAALAQQTSPDEVRAIVAEMLSDAETRSSLLAGGGAGHDGRFYLANADGSFRLNIGGQLTERYIIGFRDDNNTGGIRPGDEFTSGFQNRYAKLWFDGNIGGTDWTYMIRGNFDRGSGGNFQLENGWAGYNFGSGWKTRFGQFKLPFAEEALVDDQFQLAADRSVVDSAFNQGYSQGIEVSYETLDWRVKAAFSDGFAQSNTDYPNVPPLGADYAFTGRFEYKFAGNDFNETFKDFTSEQGKPFACLLGGAVHYQESANSNAPTDVDQEYLGYTADVTFKGDGWNVFAAGEGRHTQTRGPVGSSSNPDFDDFGLVIQGGFRVAKDTEIFARYDGIFADSDRNLPNDNFSFITGGVNQYYAGHAAKATADIVYAFDATTNLAGASQFGPVVPNTALGLLGSSKDGEVTIRLQFQLLF
jgi:hypothetical protein